MALFTKKARGRPKKTENESINENIENPFLEAEKEESTETDGENLSNLTLKELAILALPYSHRSITTLERLSRAELIKIIKDQKDDSSREAKTLDNDLGDLLEVFIGVMGEIKQNRHEKPLNPLFIKLAKSQSRKLSELFIKIGVSGGILAWVVLFVAFCLIIFDALYDVKNLPNLFGSSKKNTKEGENDAHAEKK